MESYKKFAPVIIIMLICLFVFGGCKQNKPEITTAITLSNITEEEYNKFESSSKPEGATINDLKKLYIDIKIINSKKATERKITIPNLFIINNIDRVRAIGGGTGEQNNIGTEATAASMAYVIFDSRGLSEQDLRNLYKESEIYIAYKLRNDNLVEKSISVGEGLTFNE